MDFITGLARLRLSTKLLLLNALICVVFGLFLALSLSSFQHLRTLATQFAGKDVQHLLLSAEQARRLAALFSDVEILANTYHGHNAYLQHTSTRLYEDIDTLTRQVEDSALHLPLERVREHVQGFSLQAAMAEDARRHTKSQLKKLLASLESLKAVPEAARARLELLEYMANTDADVPGPGRFVRSLAFLKRLSGMLDTIKNRSQQGESLDECVLVLENVRKAEQNHNKAFRELATRRTQLLQSTGHAREIVEAHEKMIFGAARRAKLAIDEDINLAFTLLVGVALAVVIIIGLLTGTLFNLSFKKPLALLSNAFERLTRGDYSTRVALQKKDEWQKIENTLNALAEELETSNWLKLGQSVLDECLRGDKEVGELSENLLTFLIEQLKGQVGAVYLADQGKVLNIVASYALSQGDAVFESVSFGEGLIGQVAQDKRVHFYNEVAQDMPEMDYAAGTMIPKHFLVAPIVHEGYVLGVFLVGAVNEFSQLSKQFIEQSMESISISFFSADSKSRMRYLLKHARCQAQALESQKDILREKNRELEEQANALKLSERSLQVQQEEMRVTNTELAEQAQALQDSETKLKAQQDKLERQTQALIASEKRLKSQQEELFSSNAQLATLNDRLEDKVELRTKDLEEKAHELESANVRLRELDEMKSAFLSSVSHELRTPLTSVLGFAKLITKDLARSFWPLARGDDRLEVRSRRIHENLEIIIHEGDRLSRLINDVLDLNKIESGKMEWRDINLDVEKVVCRAVRAVRGEFEHMPAVQLLTECESDLPELFMDPDRLEQVLLNFLTNAAKFTSKGYVRVRAMVAENGHLQISVEDTGTGIPGDDLDKIFEKFHQVRWDDTLREKPKGTGLGLTICREIVEHYKGVIRAESVMGKGSTFFMSFPTQGNINLQARPERSSVNIKSCPKEALTQLDELMSTGKLTSIVAGHTQGKTRDKALSNGARPQLILVVDDDPLINSYICQLLEGEGYETASALNGLSGLEMASKLRPDCITMDVMMPGLDGAAVISLLRSDKELAKIPVLVISATHGRHSAGGDEVLDKPIDEEKLMDTLHRLLGDGLGGGPTIMLHGGGALASVESTELDGPFATLESHELTHCSESELWERIDAGFVGTVLVPSRLVKHFDLSKLGKRSEIQMLIMP